MQEITIIVRQHRKTGLLVASSPDLPGLSIAAHTIEELETELPPVVRALLEADGEVVESLSLSPLSAPDADGFVLNPSYRVSRQAA